MTHRLPNRPLTAFALPRQSLKTRITLSTLAIFLASLWSLSYYASQMLHRDLERLLSEQQFATVSVVASSINADLNERVQSLELVARVIDPALLQQPAVLQKYLDTLIVLQTHFNAGVRVVGPDGVALADVPELGRVGMSHADNDAVSATLSEGQTRIGRPFMEPVLRQPVFSMAAAIRDAQGQVIGALIGSTNLSQPNFLDKMTQGRYGKSGGYMLVAPRSRQVVTATDKSRVMEVLAAPGTPPLAERFLQGYEGSGLAINSRGHEVLASAKGVPVAGWYVAAALPATEAFAPIVVMQQRMLLATLLLTLLAGGLTWWILRRQLAPMLAAVNTLASMAETPQPVQPLPISRPDEIGQLIGGFNRLLDTLTQREEALRIAAIAFECQEGIVVMDADLTILRVNQAFTAITGYAPSEAQGQTVALLSSDQHPAAFYDAIWRDTKRDGGWQGEMWQRRKNGDSYPARTTITAVRDETSQVTHYVGNLTDATSRRLQEQQRLRHEAAHRNTLVREVHHRIKNNLQGITGILRQFAQKHPETADPIRQAISQVQGISVIHGLQGRAVTSAVRLCELTGAIAGEIEHLWQTPVLLTIAPQWQPCVITEKEAVPIALVLNELMLNAVKHGGQAQGHINITLRPGGQPDVVQIHIANAGQFVAQPPHSDTPHHGLELIAALMPRHGARLVRTQQENGVMTLLELQPPVITLDQKDPS